MKSWAWRGAFMEAALASIQVCIITTSLTAVVPRAVVWAPEQRRWCCSPRPPRGRRDSKCAGVSEGAKAVLLWQFGPVEPLWNHSWSPPSPGLPLSIIELSRPFWEGWWDGGCLTTSVSGNGGVIPNAVSRWRQEPQGKRDVVGREWVLQCGRPQFESDSASWQKTVTLCTVS